MRPPARLAARFSAALFLAALSAALLAGCGGGSRHHRSPTRHGRRPAVQALDIYSSLPLSGPAAGDGRSIASGIRLAWRDAGGRAGPFLIRYHSLNDARPGGGAWDSARTTAGARRVATDAAAVAYIGEFESGATQVSLPILNGAGIPQITPWSPYVGLTQSIAGVTAPGEPNRYYPSSVRTLLRVAPDDAVQTAAMLLAAHDAGCTRLAILRGGGVQGHGRELMMLLDLQAARYGLRVVSRDTLSAATVLPRHYLLSLRTALTGCLAYVGSASQAVVPVLSAVRGELPHAQLIASDGLCAAAVRRTAVRAPLGAATGGSLGCMLPAVPSEIPGQARFLAAWRAAHGSAARPGPWAADGYAAMQIVLGTIAELGSEGRSRRALVRALFTSSHRDTALGDFRFDPAGDIALRSYGLYQVRTSGVPVLVRVLEPPPAAADLS